MASATINITVRLDVENDKLSEITAEDIQDLVSEIDYQFSDYGDFKVQSEICGINE